MVTATNVLCNPDAVYLSLKAAAGAANATLGTNIDIPTAEISLIISSLTISLPTLKVAGRQAQEKIREAANHVKKEREESRRPISPRNLREDFKDRKKQFRMNQLASRGRGGQDAHSQEIPSGALPEDLSPEQQPGADQLMRKLKNRQHGGNTIRSQNMVGSELHGGMKPEVMDSSDSSPSINVPQDEEEDTQQELADQKDEARQQKNEELTGSRGKSQKQLRQVSMQQKIDEQRKKTEKLKRNISAIKKKLPILVLVLGVAILKDVLDIVAEALSIGVWSWFDWLLDIPLGLAAFFLQIEKKGTDRIIGWGIMSIEILPYIDLLPAWTGRVIFAIIKRLMEMKELQGKVKIEEKKMEKLQKKLK
jgi:hypothetical protein